MKPIRRFIHDMLTVLEAFFQPDRLVEQLKRTDECNYWFSEAQKEHLNWTEAMRRDDLEGMKESHAKFLLLKRRFEMAKDGHFTKP